MATSWLIIISVVMVAVVGFGLAHVIGSVSCKAQSVEMRITYSWGIIEGCMVKAGNIYIPVKKVKLIKIKVK